MTIVVAAPVKQLPKQRKKAATAAKMKAKLKAKPRRQQMSATDEDGVVGVHANTPKVGSGILQHWEQTYNPTKFAGSWRT